MPAERVERFRERDEVAGNEPSPLVNQLIEGVLAVGSRLAPVDRRGLVSDGRPVEGDVFAVAFHRQLLEIGREALEILFVGEHRDSLRAEEVVVPQGQQAHQHRQVLLERGGAKMLIHLVETGEQGAPEVIRSDGEHGGQSDRRVHREYGARRPNPRIRTCWPCRCRTRPPFPRWSKRRRNVWRRPWRYRRQAP